MRKMPTLHDDLNDGGYGGNYYVHGRKQEEKFAYKIDEIRKDYVEGSNASAIVFKKYNLKNGKPIEAIDVDGFDRLYLNACLEDRRADMDLTAKIMDQE